MTGSPVLPGRPAGCAVTPQPKSEPVLSAYRPLLRVPGARAFVGGAILARIGGAMFGVAIVVMISSRRGSFGLAGAVSSVGILVLAAAGPFIGRLIDKYGQRRVALPFVVFAFVAGLMTVVASLSGWPAWTLFLFYGLSAVMPEPSPLTRARWAHLLRDDPDRLHSAMSFEQILDEGSFVLGPVLAILASTLVLPELGIIVAEVLFTLGAVVFLGSRETEPPVVPHEHRPRGSAVTRPGVLVVATALTMTGVIFGSNEVIAVAVADAAGREGFSSVILALFAFGSMSAGIVFGTISFTVTLTRRLLIAAAGMVVLEAPALVVGNLWGLAGIMLVAGSATAPLLITSTTLTQRLVPRALVTEGMAVVVTGILIGISIGAAVAGWAIEGLGAQRAYAVPVVAGAVAVLVIGARYGRLRQAELADPEIRDALAA